ncbi:MAG: DUF1553 domain-containing protein, partial [Planctomycetales bacterium]|nr:DUF1553 domain-containing protein [Planctomycetales bacterium]
GQPEHFDSYLLPEQRYLDQPPADAMPGAATPPKVSRREQLAQRLADRSNPTFVSNWANRLWALVYGRGLVDPVDMIEPSNPPIHPELYRLISEGLLQSDLRIKPFLRQLVMTQAYRRGGASDWLRIAQSSSEVQEPEGRGRLLQTLATKIAETESQIESLSMAEAGKLAACESTREAWLKTQAERTVVRAELDTAEAAVIDSKKKRDEANTASVAAQKALDDNKSRTKLLDDSAANLEQAIAIAGGEDAELSQAIAVAKQRAETARGALPMLEKNAADTQTALTAATTSFDQATTRVNEVVEKLKPIQASLQTADRNNVAAREDWFAACSATASARRERLQTTRMVDWLAAIDKTQQLDQTRRSTDQQIASANEQTTTLRDAVESKKQEITTAMQAMQTAAQAARLAIESSDQNRDVIAKLEQTLSSLDEASKLVSQAETLVSAQSTLRSEIDGKRKLLESLQASVDDANAKADEATKILAMKQSELDAQTTAEQQHLQNVAALENKRKELQSEIENAQTETESLAASVAEDSSRQFDSAGLYPLTAEQMCWSTLRVTGVLDAYIRTEIAELEKQSPVPADADETIRDQRRRQAVRQAIEKLRGIADHYVSLYASGPDKTQDDYFASADQALYVANGGSVFGWAGPGNQNPTQIATASEDPAEIARILYWSYLCRQPTAEETALVTDQLASAGDQRNAIIHEMAWSLLASAEFRFVR